VGHSISSFDLEVLMKRANHHKIPKWSLIGRLRRSRFPNMYGSKGKHVEAASHGLIAGRIYADTYLAAKDFLRSETTYSMSHFVRHNYI